MAALVRRIRKENSETRRVIFERAIARQEIPEHSDTALLVELTMSPLIARLVHTGIEVDQRFLESITEMIVAGARAGAANR